jgi:hypothetical protein
MAMRMLAAGAYNCQVASPPFRKSGYTGMIEGRGDGFIEN